MLNSPQIGRLSNSLIASLNLLNRSVDGMAEFDREEDPKNFLNSLAGF